MDEAVALGVVDVAVRVDTPEFIAAIQAADVIVLADGEGDDADAQREAFFAELGVPALLVDLKEGAVVIALCEAARDAIG